MKKSAFLFIFVLAFASFINAQDAPTVTPPSAPTNPIMRDDTIRMRSFELEQAKKKAEQRQNDPDAVTVNTEIDKKFPEIQEDFEGMQLSQAAIIKAYSMSENIDYAMIAASADKINKNAKRLDSNLFDEKAKIKSKDKDKEDDKSIRDLIVDLDNAIGAVTTSKMFQNLRVVEPEVAKSTQNDLIKVMMISNELSKAANKMK